MIKALKKKYALSDQGAKDLLKGIVYSVLANISLMFPVILLAIVLNQLLAPVLGASAPEISAAVYTVIGIVILAVVFIFHYCQYTAAYLGTYDESARRRIGLAEKLRTLPLTFFHQRDLADLTSTIMGDCANFEHAFSHTVPQFFGAVISTGIVCIGLLIFNWQMGLALLWVAPISFAIVILSRKWQEKLSKKHMNARLELAEGIQECLETVQDIKACNQEEDYLRKLDAKMDAAEKAQISSEMTTASLLTTGQMFLRLGLATVIVVGNSLVVSGDTSLFTYISVFDCCLPPVRSAFRGDVKYGGAVFRTASGKPLEGNRRIPGRNRREEYPYKRVRYYIRSCPVLLRKGHKPVLTGCFVYRKAGTGHSTGWPVRRRQKYSRKAGSQILSSGRRKNTVGRNRYCSAKFNHVDEKLLYRFSRCCAV